MEEHLSFVDKINNLPTPSPVLRQISSIVNNPQSSASDIVQALKFDPSISGRVLKLANSAYIGMPRTVSSLRNAVVLLGFKRIHSLVLATDLLAPFHLHESLPFTLTDFWRHGTTVALIAESIARHLRRYDPVDPEEVFSAAILHDIGKLVVGGFEPAALNLAYARCRVEQIPFSLAEQPDISHVKVGDQLAEHWNFPAELRAAIAGHHAPAACGEYRRFASIIHVADIMAHVLGFSMFTGETPPRFEEQALERIQLPLERLRVIAEHALDDQKRIESLLEAFKG